MGNKKSVKKGTIIEKLKAMGLKIAPDDDPMYKISPSIRFVSRKNKK